MKITKKITLNLAEIDGNAFAILGAFRKRAKEEGWSKEEIDYVTEKATAGHYNDLLQTILSYID